MSLFVYLLHGVGDNVCLGEDVLVNEESVKEEEEEAGNVLGD